MFIYYICEFIFLFLEEWNDECKRQSAAAFFNAPRAAAAAAAAATAAAATAAAAERSIHFFAMVHFSPFQFFIFPLST